MTYWFNSHAILLVCMLVLANMPYLLQRSFLILSIKKKPWHIACELFIGYIIFLIIGHIFQYFEGIAYQPQDWTFYVACFSFYLVLGFPSFVYHFL